ncbi:triose-phosphate isomerase [Canibacter sp. lx-45]|uniref:triose-phosphate isomerase n=1 Tax=Canibacter zhuwentaonis TaxID=2837491 RepID=UPI001BDD17F3|nr:triose-phosphate isomerase [Canibacter zhuwentaonis]MBT1035661.1 triose-phosphate isomerase [Canibacter zhuwentaonis]
MNTQRKPLIAGNWKMNYDHLQALAFLQKLSWSLKNTAYDSSVTEVAVFPPFTDLRSAQTIVASEKLPIKIGAQDVSHEQSGAYTGDIAAAFLSSLDVSYVIVGHSERREYHAETDSLVGKKSAAALTAGITPVICVGESLQQREEQGTVVPLVQLTEVLAEVPEGAEFVIAYEPVWAIGSGQAATAAQAQEMCSHIRSKLRELRGEEVASATRILYGGSVKSDNIAEFMQQPDVDGALVGGASLKIDEFTKIVQYQTGLAE